MSNKDILVRNIPNDIYKILKIRFEKSDFNSFNEYILNQLEVLAYKNNYEDLVNQYLERQNIMIEAIQRNNQVVNLILNQIHIEGGITNEQKKYSNENGNME